MKSNNSSDGVLKIREIFIAIIALVITGTSISLCNQNNVKIASKLKNENQNIEIEVADITNYTERDFKALSRNSEERVVEEPKETYISIEEIEISRDMDLNVRCGISKEDFMFLMDNLKTDYSGFFSENSETIYDLCKEYELNEIFFCGLIAAESGWNIASNHRNAHNYISMMSGGKLIRYEDDYEGLEAAAKLLHDRYLTEGGSCYCGTTLSAVKTRFCPNSTTWVGLVYGCMSQVLK